MDDETKKKIKVVGGTLAKVGVVVGSGCAVVAAHIFAPRIVNAGTHHALHEGVKRTCENIDSWMNRDKIL